jgi:adenosylhomocysteinase
MPVLRLIAERFAAQRPLAGLMVAACLHVTAETAGLVNALRAGGARVFLAASNPLSTQDDVAAALAADGAATVYARAGLDRLTYDEHIHRALDAGGEGPDLVMDDGGDLVNTLHAERPELLAAVRGGCESTATGVIRLRRMAAEGALAFPMVAADATTTKRMFDNTCGTGQSVIDGVLRATNILLAGRVVVVAGYGASGRGIADAARGLGAQVMVTEVDPVRALEAVLAGFRVLPMADAVPSGEVFITATGSRDVIAAGHLPALRDGAILANAGHFDVEIDVRALTEAAVKVTRDVRPHTDEYLLADGRRLLLLAEGRVVNLVAAEGNPPQVMPGARARLAGRRRGRSPPRRARRAGRDRRADRAADPGVGGGADRCPYPGSAGVPEFLAARLLTPPGDQEIRGWLALSSASGRDRASLPLSGPFAGPCSCSGRE